MKANIPIPQRPGTRLDHRFTEKVYVERDGRIHVGHYDPTHSVYQFYGVIFRLLKSMPLGPEECEAIKRLQPEWLEAEVEGKTCYSISTNHARYVGFWHPGTGRQKGQRRFQIPLSAMTEEKA